MSGKRMYIISTGSEEWLKERRRLRVHHQTKVNSMRFDPMVTATMAVQESNVAKKICI